MREIYKYNEQGYYIGSDKQPIDQLESQKLNKKVYPSLYLATDIVPPQYNPELELLKYNNGTWIIEDIELKGKYYKKSNADECDKILKKDLSLYTQVKPLLEYDDGTTQYFDKEKQKWKYKNKGNKLLEFEKQQEEIKAKEEEEQKKEKRLRDIKNEIANTTIDYKGRKWKIRKKDIGYITGYEVYADKKNITPMLLQDSLYNVVEMYYEDFVSLGKKIGEKRSEIIAKY